LWLKLLKLDQTLVVQSPEMSLSRCVGSLAILAGAEGARVARARKGGSTQLAKFIAGVPILNYDLTHEASLGELQTETSQEWVIMAVPGTTDEQLASMCKQNKNGCNLVGHPNKGGVPFVEMTGTEADLEAVIHSAKGAVKYAEPDSEVHMIPEIEAGPEAATWGLNRVGADERGRNGAGATVFVLDTGVRVSHQEFSGRAVPALDMTSGSPVECNGDLTCAGDVQGHGTHCAGTAAGESFGVAPSASVRSVKVLGDNGSGSWSWSYGALDWLASNQVRPAVASMSLGGSGTQQAMRDAVDGAVNAGVVVVVAGGNSNSDACNFSPAFVPSAITVGSTTSTDARSSFSNYGACTNIWAPGSSVVSASHTSDTGSRSLSGTSMACPHVSGGAALVLEANPSMKASAVLQQLLDDAYLNVITDLKFGDTNALLCVAEGGAPPTPTPQPTPAPPPGTWAIDGTGCVDDGANCITSLNHPGNYGNNQVCNIVLAGSVGITVSAFNTESGYDTLSMGGSSYSGTSAPPSGTYTGVISWNSDYSVTKSGWKLCKA